MRDDVAKLPKLYPTPGLNIESDLRVLGWPDKPDDLAARFEALLCDLDFAQYSPARPLKLLDFGCGLGLLLDYLDENDLLSRVDYTGVDLVDAILEETSRRWPAQRFLKRDVRDQPFEAGSFDYAVACGIFTTKHNNSYETALDLAETTLKALWPAVTFGLSFNSMSKHVDWERDDLFHWPLDDIMAFCKRDLARNVTFRLDYGLWEDATLVRKAPRPNLRKTPPRW